MRNLRFSHTSPVAVHKDVIITGGGGGEGPYPEAPGHIRGWDAKTGKRRWISQPCLALASLERHLEGDSWIFSGGTNNWAGMSVDVKRGLVFAGIGSPSFVFMAATVKGPTCSVTAWWRLMLSPAPASGTIRPPTTNVWDMDLPAQPALVTIRQGGKLIDAWFNAPNRVHMCSSIAKPATHLACSRTPMPQSDLAGERLHPTQPFPSNRPPFRARDGRMNGLPMSRRNHILREGYRREVEAWPVVHAKCERRLPSFTLDSVRPALGAAVRLIPSATASLSARTNVKRGRP